MTPPTPALTIACPTYFIPWDTPRRLTSIVRLNDSSVCLCRGHSSPCIPALLKKQSTRPHSLTACSTTSFTLSLLVTSQGIVHTSCSISHQFFLLLIQTGFRSTNTRRAPFLANTQTVARPMSPAAPDCLANGKLQLLVMNAILSLQFLSLLQFTRNLNPVFT